MRDYAISCEGTRKYASLASVCEAPFCARYASSHARKYAPTPLAHYAEGEKNSTNPRTGKPDRGRFYLSLCILIYLSKHKIPLLFWLKNVSQVEIFIKQLLLVSSKTQACKQRNKQQNHKLFTSTSHYADVTTTPPRTHPPMFSSLRPILSSLLPSAHKF